MIYVEGTYNTRTMELRGTRGAPSLLADMMQEIFEGPIDVIQLHNTPNRKRERVRSMSYVNSSKYESFTPAQMYKKRVEELEAALVMARKDLHKVQTTERIALLDKLGNGAVIRWERKFPSSEKKYTYVAVRTNDLWYVTGTETVYDTEDLKILITTFCESVSIMTPDKEL